MTQDIAVVKNLARCNEGLAVSVADKNIPSYSSQRNTEHWKWGENLLLQGLTQSLGVKDQDETCQGRLLPRLSGAGFPVSSSEASGVGDALLGKSASGSDPVWQCRCPCASP